MRKEHDHVNRSAVATREVGRRRGSDQTGKREKIKKVTKKRCTYFETLAGPQRKERDRKKIKQVSENVKESDVGEKRSRRGNGVSKGVCSWCCHANEGGAAAMLTNSNSHCWTHHLLMLYGSPPPPSHLFLSPSLYPFLSPVLSPGSLFFVRSLARCC